MTEKGVWRTVRGRRVFIKEGQSLTDAMRESGKFTNINNEIDVSKYKNFNEFIKDKEMIKKLKEKGINNVNDAKIEYNRLKFENQKIKEMSVEDSVKTIKNKIPQNITDGWFRDADSAYKQKLNDLIVNDDEIRSAGLSIAYNGYKEFTNENIGFNDFLNKEIKVYRGGTQSKLIDYDKQNFISYSYDKNIAKSFNKNVDEITIKPINTLGMYQTTGEYEILVPQYINKNAK